MVRYMEVLAAAILCLLSAGVSAGLPQNTEQAQLYFFTMDGCGPCAEMEPEIRRLADAGYPVRIVDARANPAWTNHFSVATTPTSILVAGNIAVRQQSGIVAATELAQWFHDHAASTSRNVAATQQPSPQVAPGQAAPATVVDPAIRLVSNNVPVGVSAAGPSRQPASTIQAAVMQATVRLKVEDESGLSYATGTVIHSHGTEAIVLTCGHVFRDSTGQEKITADIGWGRGESPVAVPGQLLDFDAGPRDIAVVVIRPGIEIPFVPVAPLQMVVSPGDEMFSIGCDMGQEPSIRRTRIKSLSNYDGVNKYDIYGRPVEGRSGGGLFSSGGQLVGVCNAAAVDFDEGIYTGLENVWSQLSRTNLDRVLNPAVAPAGMGDSDFQIARQDIPAASPAPIATTSVSNTFSGGMTNPGDMELIAVLRDRSTGETKTWVIAQPDQELTKYLSDRADAPNPPLSAGVPTMAALRDSMPELNSPTGFSESIRRGQSPDSANPRR